MLTQPKEIPLSGGYCIMKCKFEKNEFSYLSQFLFNSKKLIFQRARTQPPSVCILHMSIFCSLNYSQIFLNKTISALFRCWSSSCLLSFTLSLSQPLSISLSLSLSHTLNLFHSFLPLSFSLTPSPTLSLSIILSLSLFLSLYLTTTLSFSLFSPLLSQSLLLFLTLFLFFFFSISFFTSIGTISLCQFSLSIFIKPLLKNTQLPNPKMLMP
jgi:hypothetical protein